MVEDKVGEEMTSYPTYIVILFIVLALACIVGLIGLATKILIWLTRGGPNS